MKHGNIALFVPHNGCPNQCTFCDQCSITGVQYQPTAKDVDNAMAASQNGGKKFDREIAFFGGSFTAIDRAYMIMLLEAAHKYVKNGAVSGIRISTRPDAVDDEILKILKSFGVTSIELGAQSMCDDVLLANRRGHTAGDVKFSSKLIKEYGFSLGLQMMTGLYKSDDEKDIFTAREIISIKPDTVRIYPTVTMKNTELGRLYESGEYIPSTLEESVNLCVSLLKMFSENNIEVIRLGLHYSEELRGDMLYCNYHPAFKELCENKLMLDEFMRKAGELGYLQGGNKNVDVTVNPSSVSKFIGQKRANIEKLAALGFNIRLRTDNSLSVYEVRIGGSGQMGE